MKKKIFAIVAIAALLLISVVIATEIEEANENNKFGKDNFFNMGIENGLPPERDRNEHPPDNFTELTEILEHSDDSFYIKNIQLLFGPDEIIEKQASPFDYDGDEIIETVYNEINGLTGIFIIVKGYFIEENQFMVFNINNLPIGRPPHPPPRHENEKDPMNGDGPRGL